MAATPLEFINHTRRVCSLYKRMSRNLLDWYSDRAEFRYHVTLLRAEFDKHKHEKDMVKVHALIKKAEEELRRTKHYAPILFATSPGGIAFERYVHVPDSIVDFWDPVEKAHFPKYFATREQRKDEYIEMWEKKYGKQDPADHQKDH